MSMEFLFIEFSIDVPHYKIKVGVSKKYAKN